MKLKTLYKKINYDMTKFRTVQYISAKFPEFHSYLKQNGYSNHDSIFIEIPPELNDNYKTSFLMLRKNGTAFLIPLESADFKLIPIRKWDFLVANVFQIHNEINENHPYLVETLSRFEDSLNLRFGSFTQVPNPLF